MRTSTIPLTEWLQRLRVFTAGLAVATAAAAVPADAYNADDFDEDGSSALGGYGPNPPAVGFDLLTGAVSVTYFITGQAGGPQNDPNTAAGYYNFMRGVWGDGTPMTAAGDGYGDGGTGLRATGGAAKNGVVRAHVSRKRSPAR